MEISGHLFLSLSSREFIGRGRQIRSLMCKQLCNLSAIVIFLNTSTHVAASVPGSGVGYRDELF